MARESRKQSGKHSNIRKQVNLNSARVQKYNKYFIRCQMIQSSASSHESPKKQYCSFKSIDSEKVIGLSNCKGEQGSLIIQCDFAEESQCFLMVPSQEDYHIKCKLNSLYLTVENMENGCRVYCAEQSNQPNQKFRIEEAQPGSKQYFIYTFCGKVLEAASESKGGTVKRVIQNEHNGSSNQKWNLNDLKNGTFDS